MLFRSGVAAAARLRGQIAQAARLWAAATALRAAIGHPLSPVDRAVQEQGVAAARQALGDEAFAAAWATGSMVSWEEIGREIVKVVEHEEKMVP